MFETIRTNILQYSQEFGNTYWTKSNVSVSSNVVVAPDGTMTGDVIYETGNNFHIVSRTLAITANATCSLSLFAKKVTDRNIIRISIQQGSNGSVTYCNLSNGYATSAVFGGGTIRLQPTVKQFPNNWYRIEFAGSCSNNGTAVIAQILCLESMGVETYVGNTSQGYAVWGYQFEQADCPSSYIPTFESTVTRTTDTASANILTMGIDTANGFSLEVEAKYYDLTGRGSSYNTITLSHPVSPASLISIRAAKGFQPYGYVYHTGWNGSATALSTGTTKLDPGQKLRAVQSFQNNDVLMVSTNGNNIVRSTDTSFEMGLPYLLRINMEGDEAGGNGVMTVEKVKVYDRPLSNTEIYRIIDGV
jgi:hypothetical protein